MRVGIVVTDVAALKENDGSIMLAFEAVGRGHEVWLAGVGDFASEGWSNLRAWAVSAPTRTYPSTSAYLATVLPPASQPRWIDVATLDVLLLRSDAYEPAIPQHWAHLAAIRLGKLASDLGVLVLSDPDGLLRALDKIYVEQLPESCRPRGLVTRRSDAIRSFVRDHGRVVIKPVEGACGRNTFLLEEADATNFNQIIDVVISQGYVVVQEYVPEAAAGTLRLFLLNGRPLQVRGHYAAQMHLPSKGDLRSNVSAGGAVGPAVIDERTLRLAGEIGPRLAADGLFLVGVDIAGGKVLDVGANTPGGMWGAERLERVRFAEAVVVAVEERVAAAKRPSPRGEDLAS